MALNVASTAQVQDWRVILAPPLQGFWHRI